MSIKLNAQKIQILISSYFTNAEYIIEDNIELKQDEAYLCLDQSETLFNYGTFIIYHGRVKPRSFLLKKEFLLRDEHNKIISSFEDITTHINCIIDANKIEFTEE